MPRVAIEVVTQAQAALGGLESVDKKLSGLQRTASVTSGVMKGALASDLIMRGADAITGAIGDATEAVREQERLAAQTGAVLKSTGGHANVTAAQVMELSDALEAKSLADGEAIQAGQNLLLTFTEVQNRAGQGNDVYNQATQAMVDMSQAMGQSTTTSATMLGKALNDPVKGMSALSKVGVTFTDAQKKQAKAMMDTGNVAGAQKIILNELNKEFGGSAQAAANTFDGSMKKAKDALDGAIEGGVKAVMPTLKEFGDWFAKALPAGIAAAQEGLAPLQPALDGMAQGAKAALGWIQENPETVKAFAITLGVLAGAIGAVTAVQWVWNAALAANPIGIVVLGIAALVAGGVYLATNWSKVTAQVGAFMGRIGAWFTSTFQAAARVVTTGIGRAAQVIREFPGKVLGVIAAGMSRLGSLFSGMARSAAATIGRGMSDAGRLVREFPGKAVSAIAGAASQMAGAAGALIGGLIGGINRGAGMVMDAARRLAGNILGSIKSALGIASPSREGRLIGANVGESIASGLLRTGGDVRSAGRSLAGDLLDAVTVDTIPAPTLTLDAATSGRYATAPGVRNYTINVTVPLRSSRAEVGREIVDAIKAYEAVGGRL